jgi:hypothetical protein
LRLSIFELAGYYWLWGRFLAKSLQAESFCKVVDALREDAVYSRLFEGFLVDFSLRPQSKIDTYKPEYKLMWLQIDAVELSLLSFLARCWDKGGKDYRSIPCVIDFIKNGANDVYGAVCATRANLHDEVTAVAPKHVKRDWLRSKHDELVNSILVDFEAINTKAGASDGITVLQEIQIIRHESIAHSLVASYQRSKILLPEGEADIKLNREKMLDFSKQTGALIDKLCRLTGSWGLTSPDSFCQHYGEAYWKVFDK